MNGREMKQKSQTSNILSKSYTLWNSQSKQIPEEKTLLHTYLEAQIKDVLGTLSPCQNKFRISHSPKNSSFGLPRSDSNLQKVKRSFSYKVSRRVVDLPNLDDDNESGEPSPHTS